MKQKRRIFESSWSLRALRQPNALRVCARILCRVFLGTLLLLPVARMEKSRVRGGCKTSVQRAPSVVKLLEQCGEVENAEKRR